MPGDPLDDDYVAELLKQDAKAQTARYLKAGVAAFLPSRSSNQAPKPNTRFLRNIIRETDNHNAALKAKEAAESRARLKALRSQKPSGIFSYSDDLGSAEDHSRPRKRPRLSDSEEVSRSEDTKRSRKESRSTREHSRTKDRRRHRRSNSEEYSDTDGSESEKSVRSSRKKKSRRSKTDDSRDADTRERRRKHHSSSEEDRASRRSRKHRREHESDRKRARRSHRDKRRDSRSPEPAVEEKGSRRRKRNRSPASASRSSPPREGRKHKDKGLFHHLPKSSALPAQAEFTKREHARTDAQSTGSDSDPLDALIGPALPSKAPKVRSKGRGAFKSSLAMDNHFAPDYDPSLDVAIESEHEDQWGQAVEAFRDRVRWRQQGADRLRAAGFTKNEIQKWEKGGEKTEEDVIWSKKGEGREWDRGKMMDDDGQVKVQAEWGRLKGT